MPIFLITHAKKVKYLVLFFSLWLAFFIIAPLPISYVFDYGCFLFLGVLGAIFANATGSGGGVVFIPFFNKLGFTEIQAVATSFAIQCFGMTAGAFTWYRYYQLQKINATEWHHFKSIIVLCGVFSVVGLWLVYGFEFNAPASLSISFSWFSLFLGISICASVGLLKNSQVNKSLALIDWLVLTFISVLGGAITAWLSVGVGELIAIYLIIKRFDITMAVSAAVVISAITVWAGIWQHTLIDDQIYWQVVLFAGPGALIGGVLAKTLVSKLSVTRLKLFFAFWLLVIGSVGVS